VTAEAPRPSLIRRFWGTASGFWTGGSRCTAWALTALMVLVTLSQIAVLYRLTFWTRDIFDAVEMRDASALWQQALLSIPLLGVAVALAVAAVYGRMSMQREWRAWLVRRLVERWVKQGRAHHLNLMQGNHQVPEGRITDDARIATDAPVDFVVGLFHSVVGAITFIGILWVVGGSLDLPAGSGAVEIPGFLVVSVILYSALVTLAMLAVSRHFTTVSESINQAEAEFRFALTHVRENGERIALLGSESRERQGLTAALAVVIERWRRYCGQHLRVTVVSNANFLIAPVLPVFLCMPRFLDGGMTLGEVTQAAAAFVQVQSSFNWLVDNFARFADWRASARRVGTLLDSLDTLWQAEQPGLPGRIQRELGDDVVLRLRDLRVESDAGVVRLDTPDLVVSAGERVRLVGRSDAGKAALLHAITGLTDRGAGAITAGRNRRVFVMPQHPYMPIGSLRQVACYPATRDAISDEALRALLDAFGLGGLTTRLDDDAPWEQLLSDGERQRLAFVRACIAAPDLLLLDDPAAGLDAESQKQTLAQLLDHLPGVTIVDFSNRGDADALFDRTLHFELETMPTVTAS
jgi:putative ATP-binding cassette transporter